MDSRRVRRIVALIVIIILAVLLFLFFFLKKQPQTPPVTIPDNPFGTSTGQVILPGSGSTTASTSNPVISNLPAGKAALISGCDSSISIERNDCVKKTAVKAKDPALCAAISGTFGQVDCANAVIKGEEKPIDVFTKATKTYTFDFITPTTNRSTTSLDSLYNDAISKAGNMIQDALKNPDPRYTADGFYKRVQESQLKLFGFSEYQIRPGSSVVANGAGFTESGNDIHFGGYTVAGIGSKDGMTMQFALPTSMTEGTYEAWVTNSKGSSKNDAMKIQVVITNNPAPRPVITSVTPAVPTASDTVTLNGQSLSGTFAVLTSLGMLKNISSTPTTATFNLNDFEVVSKIKNLPTVKGKKIPVSVIVASPQGYNKEAFVFDVQF